MSAGLDLAQKLWDALSPDQRKYVERSEADELSGFLIGTFWDQHSRIALYNAAAEMYSFCTEPIK